MTGIKNIEIKDINVPEIKENEVLIKIEYVGICGSDVHFYEYGKIGDFIVKPPFILGHECAGTIVKKGKDVSKLKIGDRVALEPGITCGKCFFCKTGRYNLCRSVQFLATPPYHGSLQKYIAYPEEMAFKLPDNLSTFEGAFVEPLSVGIHATGQGNVSLGDNVVILGAGCIGLVTMLSAKARGASNLYISDVIDKRLAFAKKIGATDTFNAAKTNVIDKIMQITNGIGADITLDASGSEKAIESMPFITRCGGTMVLIGVPLRAKFEFNFSQIIYKEITVKTVMRYRNVYPTAINAISAGTIKVKDMVTQVFDFSQTKEAFDFVVENANDVIKAVIMIA